MFKLVSTFKPTGDQPQAIKQLLAGLKKGLRHQTLLGVTGSGKTFTMANVIAKINKPTLIISHNKTLAAQLFQEFKAFFPENSVHYFVSYYDYYQPEAYLPATNTYIEKDAKINEEIDRLRHAATQALLTRDDVIIIASVSCIYNLGSPDDYNRSSLEIFQGQKITNQQLYNHLIRLQYQPNLEIKRGGFRKTTDEFEIAPSTGEEIIKIKLTDNKIDKISIARNVDLENIEFDETKYARVLETRLFPAKYWIAAQDKIDIAIQNIRAEMQKHTQWLRTHGLPVEAARLRERTEFDITMIQQTGYCYGIENYSRHLEFREAGKAPFTLIDFFKTKQDFLTIVDESHISIPQIRGMFHGDHSRKQTLVKHGFRLPSALDNRPLRFPEFEKRVSQVIYVSATPGTYEIKKSGKNIAEQLVRPTGLLDPTVEIVRTAKQIEHLLGQIRERISKNQRVLVTTLTKRMAEDLTEYLAEQGIKVNYIHSEIKTLQRLEIIRDLRLGNYDVIVGVNLLREGLDLPEVSLIAILDADKEGFLRNATTLIQTMGRAARHIDGHILLYADKNTRSMQAAIYETQRRRARQEKYNTKHGITPMTINKAVAETDLSLIAKGQKPQKTRFDLSKSSGEMTTKQRVRMLEKEIERAIKRLEYERAIELREELKTLKRNLE